MTDRDRSLIYAIRGPVTLIVVGVLFALQNFTPYGFDRTWPALLIVFGLFSLFGRGAEARPPYPGAPGSGPNVPPQGATPTQTGGSR